MDEHGIAAMQMYLNIGELENCRRLQRLWQKCTRLDPDFEDYNASISPWWA